MFHNHIAQLAILLFVYFNFQILRKKSRRQECLDWIITWIWEATWENSGRFDRISNYINKVFERAMAILNMSILPYKYRFVVYDITYLITWRLHIFQSSASSISSQYLHLLIKSSRSCVLLLPTLFISVICPSMASWRRQFLLRILIQDIIREPLWTSGFHKQWS